jgi:hypothetical protein
MEVASVALEEPTRARPRRIMAVLRSSSADRRGTSTTAGDVMVEEMRQASIAR